jgi:hypothetical protein
MQSVLMKSIATIMHFFGTISVLDIEVELGPNSRAALPVFGWFALFICQICNWQSFF